MTELAAAPEVQQPVLEDPRAAIERLFELRAEITEIKKNMLKPLEEEENELKDLLIAHLTQQGVDQTAVRGVGSVSITESVVPSVENWDAFYSYIRENNAFYMLNRAPNSAAFREVITMGETVPGVAPFTKKNLSVKKLR